MPHYPRTSSQVTDQYDKHEARGCNEKQCQKSGSRRTNECVPECEKGKVRIRKTKMGQYMMGNPLASSGSILLLMTFFFPHLLSMCSHQPRNSPELISRGRCRVFLGLLTSNYKSIWSRIFEERESERTI